MKSADPLFRVTGAWVLKVFIAGFGVVFAANALLAYFALESWSGLETKHPYETGLAHNTVLDEAAAQAELGWDVAVGYRARSRPGVAREGELVVRVRDAEDHGVNGLDGKALFWRPTNDGSDRLLDLKPNGDGLYGARVVLPAAGQWDVRLELMGGPRSDRVYRVRRRLQVR